MKLLPLPTMGHALSGPFDGKPAVAGQSYADFDPLPAELATAYFFGWTGPPPPAPNGTFAIPSCFIRASIPSGSEGQPALKSR